MMETPRTNEIWGGLLFAYPHLQESVDKTAELERELIKAQEEIKKWRQSFDGHVYVEDKKYVELCKIKEGWNCELVGADMRDNTITLELSEGITPAGLSMGEPFTVHHIRKRIEFGLS